jgi:hypothetical protein
MARSWFWLNRWIKCMWETNTLSFLLLVCKSVDRVVQYAWSMVGDGGDLISPFNPTTYLCLSKTMKPLVSINKLRRVNVLFTLFVFIYAHSDVQHILFWVFALFFVVLCTLCCQFLCIVLFWWPLRYSLTFIHSLSDISFIAWISNTSYE